MTDVTYGAHMRWCKDRALVYVDRGDLMGALMSMASDIRKHPKTDTRANTLLLAGVGARYVDTRDVRGMRSFIEGFASDPPSGRRADDG